jgi:8-oxo-dGTP pyrophosphatase MutT (NUDIX family)
MSTALVPTIRIAAALIDDDSGRMLLVRKAGTPWFMQAGGKIEPGETPFRSRPGCGPSRPACHQTPFSRLASSVTTRRHSIRTKSVPISASRNSRSPEKA